MVLRFVRSAALVAVSTPVVLYAGCDDPVVGVYESSGDMCIIPTEEIVNGGPGKDGIPALTDPPTVSIGDPGADYLSDDERVIGFLSPTGPLAVPLQILWWHEIVNISVGGRDLAVTHCPLTGSSLAFDREAVGGAEFGVSGLLYRNNLIMYDRRDDESLWPQMSRGARCCPRVGFELPMVPIIEMTWDAWSTLHPDTRVVSSETGHVRDYEVYPYGFYDVIDNPDLLFPLSDPIDTRRLPKELVLGVPGSEGGLAYPFGELESAGPVAAIEHDMDAAAYGSRVVFWDARSEAAALYERWLDGTRLTFTVSDDVITDIQTGSEWRVDGLATSGPLAGQRLTPVPEAYVTFWFAWAVFEPRTLIWQAP